ncbi:MAG TPA: SRPBCC family protein [Chloroflexota bacterium]|nr:SRPBCC family protein [Chloroflexota bacterium]
MPGVPSRPLAPPGAEQVYALRVVCSCLHKRLPTLHVLIRDVSDWEPVDSRPMARMESSVVIRRPVPEVFAFVANYENDPLWRIGITELVITTPGPPGVGSETREVLRFLGQTYTTTARVTEYTPPTRIAFQSLSGPQPVRGWRLIEPVEEGARVTHALEADPVGVLGRILLPVQAALLGRQMQRESQRLKSLLERGAPTSGDRPTQL